MAGVQRASGSNYQVGGVAKIGTSGGVRLVCKVVAVGEDVAVGNVRREEKWGGENGRFRVKWKPKLW
ncbi:MAG: hypothetical protein DWQ04_16000 [Chloroflexi bacterium]|nr:MAG: hypothetical protein DWQ04_16000 [Chloroflexota bacterium]